MFTDVFSHTVFLTTGNHFSNAINYAITFQCIWHNYLFHVYDFTDREKIRSCANAWVYHKILVQFRWIYETDEQYNQTVSNNSDDIVIISSGTLISSSSWFEIHDFATNGANLIYKKIPWSSIKILTQSRPHFPVCSSSLSII